MKGNLADCLLTPVGTTTKVLLIKVKIVPTNDICRCQITHMYVFLYN